MIKTAFFAYPNHKHLNPTIMEAANSLKKSDGILITPWQKLPIEGFKLDNLIRERIANADILLADITYPNFNVYYEIGYALACRKAVVPTVNGSIEAGHANSKLIGIFDTIGYMKYENSDELRKKILGAEYPVWVEEVLEKQNHNQPLFLLDTFSKTEFRNYIRQAIDNAKVQCRSFDPTETPRLSSTSAIKSISASTGVILPLLSNQIQDSQILHQHSQYASATHL